MRLSLWARTLITGSTVRLSHEVFGRVVLCVRLRCDSKWRGGQHEIGDNLLLQLRGYGVALQSER